MAFDIQTTYDYKVYDKDGEYLGKLEGVTSEFDYDIEINSAGSSIEIVLEKTGDTSDERVQPIETEGGLQIETESSEPITTERTPDVVGNFNSKALIVNNNIVKVVEYSTYNPNGVVVFQGYISRWRAVFGASDNIIVTVLGFGTGLDNYIIEEPENVDLTQNSQNTSATLGTYAGFPAFGQTFVAGDTSISSIEVYLSATSPTNVNLSLYNSAAEGKLDILDAASRLGRAIVNVSNTSPGVVRFTFSTPVTTIPGNTYFFAVKDPLNTTNVTIYYQNTDIYAGGAMHLGVGISPFDYQPTPVGATPASDLYFITYSSGGATGTTFVSFDPSNIIRNNLDSYNSTGGEVTYTPSSIQDTGVTVTYTFSVNTLLEGIRKMLSIAPANWYWFVDPGTNVLYFKETNSSADHTFIKGRHIESLDLQATIEHVKNIVYFTGGETAGTNLFLKATNANSLAANRVGVERITDGRVTIQATGEAIQQAFLDENSTEQYTSSVTILSNTYDISTITVGQTVQFRNFGVSFVENIILQIVSVRRMTDMVILKLGVLPRRQNIQIESIQRRLLETQTANNPTTPS